MNIRVHETRVFCTQFEIPSNKKHLLRIQSTGFSLFYEIYTFAHLNSSADSLIKKVSMVSLSCIRASISSLPNGLNDRASNGHQTNLDGGTSSMEQG